MKIFLDSAQLTEIQAAESWGIINGVTTNPTLIRQAVSAMRKQDADIDMDGYITRILATVGRLCPVSLEVAGLTAEDMIEQGKILYDTFEPVAGNVVIKIPVCTVDTSDSGKPFDGIVAIRRLSEEKIPVNATLVFTPEQALLAAKAGAEYVSPFAGRVDDRIRRAIGQTFDKREYFPAHGVPNPERPDEPALDHGLASGIDLIARIAAIFSTYAIETEIIAASVRNPIQARECAEVGAAIATLPFPVLTALVLHPGTQAGIDAFTGDLVEDYTALFSRPPADD